MQFLKRGKKPSQDADITQDGSAPPAITPPNEEGDEAKNDISLARTKTEDIVYPSGLRLTLLMTSVFISSTYSYFMAVATLFCLENANYFDQCSWWHSYVTYASPILPCSNHQGGRGAGWLTLASSPNSHRTMEVQDGLADTRFFTKYRTVSSSRRPSRRSPTTSTP